MVGASFWHRSGSLVWHSQYGWESGLEKYIICMRLLSSQKYMCVLVNINMRCYYKGISGTAWSAVPEVDAREVWLSG